AWIMFPFMILLNPWLYFGINIYALWTWNTRSWGGPRADANQADDEESLQQVVADDSSVYSSDSEIAFPPPAMYRTRSYASSGSSLSDYGEKPLPSIPHYSGMIFGAQPDYSLNKW
ncbi:hypothetical protein HDU91_004231, partial [Kappamyces sp. JEL0680]